jgi:hypothetical protein
MSRRTIQSPGVEIRESDLSLRTVSQGTTTYITGFANQGPTDEVVGVSDITEFEQIYGAPRTPAERYFYHTARAALNSTGQLLVNRLPYGENAGVGFGSYYSLLAYPAVGYDRAKAAHQPLEDSSTQSFTLTAGSYYLGAPKQFNLTEDEYLQLKNGELFVDGWGDSGDLPSEWTELASLSSAAVIILNKSQSVIDGQFNGYYVGLADNTNINPASAFDSILSVETVTQSAAAGGLDNYTTIPANRLEFSLSATPEFGNNPATNSISQVMEDRITNYNIATREFDDTLNVGVFKLRQSVFSKEANRIDYLLEEGYNGSIGYYRQRNSENGGAPVNFFLGNVDNTSRNIDIIVNPFLSEQMSGLNLNDDGTPRTKIRVLTSSLIANAGNGNLSEEVVGTTWANLTGWEATYGTADSIYALGAYGNTSLAEKTAGNIPLKLDRALDRIRNDRKFNIDIIAEGGVGSIWTYNQTAPAALSGYGYDDTRTTAAIEALRTSNDIDNTGEKARTAYTTIFNKFATFCGPVKDGGRGDILYVADPIRQLVVTGKNNKIQDDKSKNFYVDAYWALRHQFELANTSYATVFANYMKVYDNYSGIYAYIPSSGFAAAKMASTDAQIGPWGAPAGLNRGIITDASDIALSPNQRQRDDLYTANLNPITNLADQGNVFFGQKTLLRKPSAFDRINVRRTFIYLEKITKRTMQYFLFENNTLFTRTRVVNTLTPFFERVKADDGIYDFVIVCDERNNTPEVIDQNELVVDIYLKPVRTAEFVLVNFFATRTDASFEEIIG